MRYTYEFKDAQGKICCAGSGSPPRLCPACEARSKASMPSAPQWRAALVAIPPAPSLIAAIQTQRGTKKPPAAPRALAANGIPVAPSLIDAIRAHRVPGMADAIQSKRPPSTSLVNGVPVAPSTIDAIQAHRGGR